MSEENTTPENTDKLTAKAGDVMKDTEVTSKPQEPNGQTLNDLKIGYVVGLSKDNNFVFEVGGENRGVVELLGIHTYASKRIEQLVNGAMGQGDKLVQELGQLLLQLNAKVDKLVSVSSPQNKL